MFRIASMLILTLASPAPVQAVVEEGRAAYKRGDYVVALRLLRPLAEQGNSKAQFNLGLMYENGRGVTENTVQAVKWYRLAADKGHAQAQNTLGVMYEYGQGVPRNDNEAMRWYRRAAERGSAQARTNLKRMYDEGRDFPSKSPPVLRAKIAPRSPRENYTARG